MFKKMGIAQSASQQLPLPMEIRQASLQGSQMSSLAPVKRATNESNLRCGGSEGRYRSARISICCMLYVLARQLE